MRQTNETFSVPPNNDEEICLRLGFDQICYFRPQSGKSFSKSSQIPTYRSLPPVTLIFVIAALVNFATVGTAAPMQKAKIMRRSLATIDLPSIEDTILPDTQRHKFATKYFIKYGHLTSSDPTTRQFRGALRSFQNMVGLDQTGILDDVTFEQMTQPRCGNTDVSGSRERRKRFVFVARWENKVKDNILRLKWFIQNYTKDIPRGEIKNTVRQAFHLWSSQIKIKTMTSLTLEFEEANSEAEADISIMWAEGEHGDSHKFDGAGENGENVLAHTFFPNYKHQSKGNLNGDIHFDDYENWHVNSSRDGASFPHVLVHEIGHALGLGHSKKQQAIMYPIYRKDSLEVMQLDLDDKCAIHWSYVGATDMCLYIWLLSEILPRKIAMEKDAAYMIDDQTGQLEQSDSVRNRLKNTPIPVCLSNNDVQSSYESMLIQRLQFPPELANTYSDVLCRFFDGMQKEYDSPITNNFHDTFRIRGSHSYFQQDGRFEALEQSDFEAREFNSQFFQWILNEFTNE